MVKRKVDVKIFIIVGILTTIIFFSGFFMDFILTEKKTDVMSQFLSEIREEQRNTQLQFLLLEEANKKRCDLIEEGISGLTDITRKTRKKVAQFEQSGRVFTSEFKNLKKQYMNLLIKNWLLFKNYKKECKPNLTLINYFYSNKNCDKCDNQGTVLTYIQKKRGNVNVFALDADLNLTTMSLMKSMFNVSETVTQPVLIINGKKYKGFKSSRELTKILT